MSDIENNNSEGVQELSQELKDIRDVMYQARSQCILTKGIRQCLKVIESNKALFCFIASDCDNDKYTNLLTAICKEKGVKIIKIAEKIQLGEWTAQCKFNQEGEAIKISKCSCAVIGTTLKTTDAFNRIKIQFEQH
ncbi:40S ribosomal protein S12 [Entamoeba marina]